MVARQRPTRAERLIYLLGLIAKQGRWCLVLGLFAGLTLPGLAATLKPWLPELIALLLFVSALRIGVQAAIGNLGDIRQTLTLALIYQLAAPLLALGLLSLAGLAQTPAGLALILLLAAPSVTGAPNFAIMMDRDPTAAMRLLLVGTAIFPLTVIPILLLLPVIPTFSDVLASAARLLLVIFGAVGLAFAIRRGKPLSDDSRSALDGVAAILLAVVVVGLMSAIGPALREAPQSVALWLGFAMTVNFGLQITAYQMGRTKDTGTAIIGGNRNIALWLVALPDALTAHLLLFIGCYQVPMYLTPILMRRWITAVPPAST